MTIGFDGSRAFLKDRTGTENYSYQLLKALAKTDTENRYLVYIRLGSSIDKKNWPDNFKFKIINWPRLWTQGGLSLQTFTDKLDVLFISSHTLPIIKKPGLKVVLTVHDLGVEYLPQTHQLKQRLYLKFMTNMQLKNATKIIAVSNATKKDLIEKIHINPKNIKVIYEGINRQLFKPVTSDKLVSTLGYYDLQFKEYFLFVGTIQPRKNIVRLIEAFARFLMMEDRGLKLGVLKLVLVGQKGWLSEEIYALPEKLGIKDKVRFLPPEGHHIDRVEDKDLVALYSGAVALCYPSLFEGFGLPILEAFACNCPVITSNCSSLPEVAGNAAILINPYDIEAINQSMQKIIFDKNLRRTLIKKGQKQVDKFSWEKCAKETLEVFREVTSL